MRIQPHSLAFTVLLGLFATLSALAIDMSAPTLALLPRALGTSRTLASLTLSLFLAGFAVGQIGGGNLSDGQGRRPVLLGGLACYTLAGLACALAPSGEMLALSRTIQGLGAGACSVISFAMVQDLFEGETARAKRSYVTMIHGVVPILAPALGAVLTDLFGWRSVHGVLAAAGGVLLVLTWAGVAESRPTNRRNSASAGSAGLAWLWRDTIFLRLALANAFSYGVIFAYIAGSPVVHYRADGAPLRCVRGRICQHRRVPDCGNLDQQPPRQAGRGSGGGGRWGPPGRGGRGARVGDRRFVGDHCGRGTYFSCFWPLCSLAA